MSSNPIIAVENLMESAALITPTSEATGFEIENAYSGFTFDSWKVSAPAGNNIITIDMGADVLVNYFAFVVLDDTETDDNLCFFYKSSDNFSTSTSLSEIYYGTEKVVFIKLPETHKERYWRINFYSVVGTHTATIASFSFGMCVQFPEGIAPPFTPPHLGYNDKILNSNSQGGAFIGRSLIRQANKGTLSVTHLDPMWLRGTWNDIADSIRTKPFYLDWSNNHFHNLLKYSEDIGGKGWRGETSGGGFTNTGTYTDGPDGEDVEIIQLTAPTSEIIQSIGSGLNDSSVYSVRFYGILLSGTLGTTTVTIGDGAGVPFTLTGSWQEFELTVTSGVSASTRFDINFNTFSGSPTIALTRVQAVKGNIQLEYQKTEGITSESAYCWTSKSKPAGAYQTTTLMQTSIDFECETS